MHMADALVTPAVAGTMYACSAGAAGYTIYMVRKENDPKKIPLMGVMGAYWRTGNFRWRPLYDYAYVKQCFRSWLPIF